MISAYPTCIFYDFSHDFETHTDLHVHVKSAPPLHINPVKQYTKFKVEDIFL